LKSLDISNLSVTVVGLGLIGGSFAKSIRQNLKIKNLWAVDINEEALDEAASSGVIDKGFTEPQFPLENSDIVILCTYPNITIEFLKNNMKFFKSKSIITDTIGIKNKIISDASSIIRDDLEFVGGHPMSGKESTGYNCSDANIFNQSQYILTPSISTSRHAINLLKQIIMGIGFKEVIEMSSQTHDEIVAFTSQLPHVIACTLMNNIKLDNNLDCIAGSFKDVTRVADINCELWSELLYENKTNILEEIDTFIKDLNNIRNIIKCEDIDYLKSFFEKSSLRRKEMNT